MNIKLVSGSLLSAEIEKNIADEASAREGYFRLRAMLTDAEDIAVLDEIIGDELNHSEKLKALSLKINGVRAATD